jgi:uncharacterized protein YjiS (DUF1127 family)
MFIKLVSSRALLQSPDASRHIAQALHFAHAWAEGLWAHMSNIPNSRSDGGGNLHRRALRRVQRRHPVTLRHFAQALHFARSPGRELLGRHVEAPKIPVWWRHWEKPMSKNALSFDLQKNAAFRDSHIVISFVEALAAFYVSFRQWRGRRRTRKALAELDERQLHDIGLTRGEIHFPPVAWWRPRTMAYRALAELDDADTRHLSDPGRRVRQEALQRLKSSDRAKTGDRR